MSNTDQVDKADAWDAISDKNQEIERLRSVLTDIAYGSGMEGASAEADLVWAMSHAGKSVGLHLEGDSQ